MGDDSIEGIYDTLKQCAQISKNAGGIGVAMHCIRGSGSYIKGTNGTSNGIVPMLRVFNNTARYVDQGGGKRKGSFAMYIEPWHSDIFKFLELRKNHGSEEERARDFTNATERSSRPCTFASRKRRSSSGSSRRGSCGAPFCSLRWRREPLICAIRTRATRRATKRTWAP